MILYDGDYKWLRQVRDKKFFLPNIERMYPLAYLQHMSTRRTMEWDLSKSISGVSLDKLGANRWSQERHIWITTRTSEGWVLDGGDPSISRHLHQPIPKGEGWLFHRILSARWVHSSDKSWWGKMVGFVLTELEDSLKQAELYQAIRVVQYGIPQSSHHFYGVLEHYRPCTFFTPVGEMGLALHEL